MLQLPSLDKVAVSRCLIGEKCRYDGKYSKDLKEFSSCLSICPEVLGGLSVPRIPCQIDNGTGGDVLSGKARIIGSDGNDYTKQFMAGANKALEMCLNHSIETVILKEKSPSCGVNKIYNNGELRDGCGLTCALLKQHGIKVISDCEVFYE